MRATMDRADKRSEWCRYETKAAAIHQERLSEELQLEKLKLRLNGKLQELAVRDRALTAA
jgi:hypothetical protein